MSTETSAYQIQYDDQGRPYLQLPGQAKNYISPAAYGKPIGGNAESAWHSGAQWNNAEGKAENPFKWNKAISLATGAAIAAPYAISALGGSSALGPSTASNMAATSAAANAAPASLAATTGATGGSVGFMSTLGKYLANHAGDYLQAATDIGRTAAGAAGSMQNQRNTENNQANSRDRNVVDLARAGIDQTQAHDRTALDRAALIEKMAQDRANMGIKAPMDRTKQAAYGDALQNVQDVNIDFKPNTGALPSFGVTGGLRPSMFGANARQAGGELSRQALMALMTKSDIPAPTDVPELSPLATLPTLSTPQGAGAGENVLGGIGIGGSLLGAAADILKKRQQGQPVAQMQDQGPYGV